MKKQTTQIIKHLNLLKDIGALKLSLLWFIQWSKADTRLVAVIAKSVISRFERIAITRGRLAAIDEMKAARLAFTRWLCGRPLTGAVGAPITKNGLPKVIPKEVRSLIIRDHDSFLIKAVITCLSIGRYFKGGKPLNLETISATFNPVLPKRPEMILAMKRVGLEIEQSPPQEWKFQWVVTAGPNGPSISSCLKDLPRFNELFRSQVEVMLPGLLPYIDKLLMWEKTFKLSSLMKLDGFKDLSLRKISVKDDREGKSRPFAIFDYWSQTTLSPLHNHLYKILRSIPQDCTFDQAAGVAKIQQYQTRKGYYSYDLTAATDRFPAVLQRDLLSLMFGTSYANAWHEIMTREPFRLKGVEQPIKFGVGQPLGAKSSWAMFTLCHHLVVHIAAIRSNSEAHYVILGDDIVLRGRALAIEYKRIMSDLGVSISEAKSHVSKDTFEFAKMWTHRGQNLSGFPIVGLAETLSKPLELAALMVFEAPAKGYLYSIDPRSVSQFFSPIALWNTRPQRHAVWIADKVVWYFSFLSWLVTKDGGWAKYIAQTASLVMSPSSATDLFSQAIKLKWRHQLDKSLRDFSEFGIGLFENIKKLPPFKPVWDPKAWPGSMSATGIAFSPAANTVPLFQALSNECSVAHSDYLQAKLEDDESRLSYEDIEQLRLPPKPQIKGFVPVRAKENIRTLSLVSNGLNRSLTTLANDIRTTVYTTPKTLPTASLEKGDTVSRA